VSDPSDVVLETERLILRLFTPEDLDALAALYADPEVRRYFPEGTLTRDETQEELAWIIDVYYARFGYGLWATVLKRSGAFIGRCGLLPWAVVPGPEGMLELDFVGDDGDEPDGVEGEVAYLLAREHWGDGLATEAARAIVGYGFERLGVSRLICLVDPDNGASLRVAQKIGMAPDGDVEQDGEVFPLYSIVTPFS
jgi:ribosomal-protein-alanine N-acetyltransferase